MKKKNYNTKTMQLDQHLSVRCSNKCVDTHKMYGNKKFPFTLNLYFQSFDTYYLLV